MGHGGGRGEEGYMGRTSRAFLRRLRKKGYSMNVTYMRAMGRFYKYILLVMKLSTEL